MTAPMTPKNVSAGFIIDLSFVSLAYGLMHTALEIEKGTCEEFGATKRGADYKVNKQLDRRIEKLKDELWHFMKIYSSYADKVMVKNRQLFRLVLSHITDSIQLDYLAVIVLHLRFLPNERSKPLDEAFSWITNSEGQLMAIMDLLDKTECRNKEGEMFILADKIVRDL
ncbi:MAG: hypothetical protein EOM50_17565 [Erysipelotrichia bacterium]|nr:hypothetical protein [Erysipelotrichia bacterium]